MTLVDLSIGSIACGKNRRNITCPRTKPKIFFIRLVEALSNNFCLVSITQLDLRTLTLYMAVGW